MLNYKDCLGVYGLSAFCKASFLLSVISSALSSFIKWGKVTTFHTYNDTFELSIVYPDPTIACLHNKHQCGNYRTTVIERSSLA